MKFLKDQFGIKFGFVFILLILLQLPVAMVSNLISERVERQQDVQEDIARSSSGRQRVMGPFIRINYIESVMRDDGVHAVERSKFILPETFEVNADLDSFEKYRGIYKARLYKAQTSLKGKFDLSEVNDISPLDIESINLVVGITDSRGLLQLDKMKLKGKSVEVIPGIGKGVAQLNQGFHISISTNQLMVSKELDFDLSFLLQGMSKFQITPIGKQTNIKISSPWPHPSFVGDYLPVSSDISDSGFNAQWASNNFSSNINQLFTDCVSNNAYCRDLYARSMGVELVEPVNHYLKSYRTINYSLLVITLVFASFFLLELFQVRPIHPIQYGFVGLSLALFYLLLCSLSEHIGFNWAYIVSVLASTSVLSIYVGGILNHRKHGSIFGLCLLSLYAMLYGLLQAENYALLMGTFLCFTILSCVMIITRKVNWYEHHLYDSSKEIEDTETEEGGYL